METGGKTTGFIFFEISDDANVKSDILSYEQREYFYIVNYVFICGFLGLFGIVANVINIIVYYRHGFANTVNISFFALAISDLCCLVSMEWVCVCVNPLVEKSEAPWIAEEFQYFTGGWPHVTSARITSCITVYITAERCLCILMPLKIKRILTPKRTTVVICLIYIINLASLIPEYSSSFLDWRFFPDRNRTLLTIAYTSYRKYMEGVVFILYFITGLLSFIAVTVFTVILIIKLRQSTQWRKEAASNSEMISGRDKKTVKMVVIIAVVLIVAYIPGTIFTMTTFIEREFFIGRDYKNLFMAMWSIGFMFQATNSSVNIFLYYTMSSKYRQTIKELFIARRRVNSNEHLREDVIVRVAEH